MPNVRLTGKLEPMTKQTLFIEPANGERADRALLHQPENFSRAASKFVHDEAKMWKETAHKVSEIEELPRRNVIEGMREDSVKTIESFLRSKETQTLLDLPIVINGRSYQSLREICSECLELLRTQNDPVVVLGHGDEHLLNLFVDGQGEEANYQIIDPRRRLTRRSPAHVINNFLGTSLLFVVDYDRPTLEVVQANGRQELQMNYRVSTGNTNAYERVLTVARDLNIEMENLGAGDFMTKEYLFANLIRSYIRRVAVKNEGVSDKNRIAHLAEAVEIYSDFSGFLNGNHSEDNAKQSDVTP